MSKYDASRMLMSKNVNNDVSKDRSIEYPPSARRRAVKAVLEEKWRWRETYVKTYSLLVYKYAKLWKTSFLVSS